MFRDINEVKTKAIKELKFLIKNNNEKVVEFINEKGLIIIQSFLLFIKFYYFILAPHSSQNLAVGFNLIPH